MRIFDFFRKIFWYREVKKKEKEKIAFSEIKTWIENKEKQINIKEKEIFDLIKARINLFNREIKEKINILESINIESKKAEDRIKSFTEEGRKKYIEFVELFVKNFNNLKEAQFDKLIANINHIFLNFNKSSHMSYERATILIGKEMANIRDEIKSFSKDLIKIFEENKNIADSSKLISIIKIKLRQFEEIERDIKRINESIKGLDRKITEKEDENKKIIDEIEEIKKSSDYLEQLKTQEKAKSLKQDMEKEIIVLRKLIDFKALARFYHILEDKMKIVKNHSNKFLENFQKDNGQGILNLLDQAKLNNKDISDKINEIHEKREEIIKNQTENEKNKDKTLGLYFKITGIVTELDNLKNLKVRAEKRLEKSNLNKESLGQEIKEEFARSGVEIEEV